MPKKLTMLDYKKMPWKNGKGETIEIFRIDHSSFPDAFLVRLSVAKINESAPFSIFPGVKRALLILSGGQLKLHFKNQTQTITSPFIPTYFSGDETVYGELIGVPVQDFNVMVDENWGNFHLEVIEGNGQLAALEDYLLIFNPVNFHLTVLQKGEMIELEDPDQKKIVIRIFKNYFSE